MTRGLYPPDTLTKDDISTLNQVRRELWYNAFIGGGFGAGTGFVLHAGAQVARKYGLIGAKMNRNTLMLSVLGGGAFGMFLFAVSTGKEQVHNLHPIFQVGAAPPGDLGRHDYQTQMNMSGERDGDLDIQKMHQTRVTRRRTMADSFSKHGLSDSHGGHWFKENQS